MALSRFTDSFQFIISLSVFSIKCIFTGVLGILVGIETGVGFRVGVGVG